MPPCIINIVNIKSLKYSQDSNAGDFFTKKGEINMRDQGENNFFNNMRPHQKLGMLTPRAAAEKFVTEK